MKKTLFIDWIELFGNYSDINFDEILNSEAGCALMKSDEHDAFFLLDSDNYKRFINYFSIELDDSQKEEIYAFFAFL